MVTACATGGDGQTIAVLGLTRGNVDRLIAGEPIRVTAETHPGFPASFVVMLFFGETDRDCANQLAPLIGPRTKVVAVPKTAGQSS